MKKLLLASVFSLFATWAAAQAMTTYSPYCCNSGIGVTASYFSRPGALNHYWTIAPSDALGNPSSAPIHTSSTFSGGNGNYTVPLGTTTALCGSYALVTLYVEKAGTPNYWLTFTNVIYVNPAPVITGPSPICGTGTYCISNLSGSGYSYDWEALSGVTNVWTGPDASCVTVPANAFNNMYATVTDANGCVSTTTLSVTNNYIDPTFYVSSVGAVDAGHFKIAVQRLSSTGASLDGFTVAEVNTTVEPYTDISGTVYYNANWSSTPYWYTPIYFYNYDGDYSPPWTSPTYYAFGHFINGHTYRVTRTITNGSCVSTYSIAFNQSGVICTNCRTAEAENASTGAKSPNAFDVFPNPGNGSFQIQLANTVENAQAELVNMLGERIDVFTFSGSTYSYSPVQAMPAGVYLLRITDNGTVISKRIVVE